MGFISFNENYYRRKLEEYENKILSDTKIREAKQLLKVLDDLTDEGYTNLNDTMETDFSCLTRLRAVLHRCGEVPFPVDHERLSDTVYGKKEYELDSAYSKKRILPVINEHPELERSLLDLLSTIKQSRIVVIESGYMGTIPMMLKALDDRVDFRLFTTAPFLYETWQDRIFCRNYEDIRRFETLYSQDLFMQYSSYHSGKFYVNVSAEESVWEKTLSEISRFMR